MIVEFLKKNIVIVCIVAVLMVIMIMIIISIQESYSYTLVSDLATQANLPIGAIIMWSGSTDPTSGLPYGWVLCDGSTYPVGSTGATITTPDLRSKFIVGASNANNGPSGLAFIMKIQ